MRRPNWLQFLTIKDKEQTHRVVLYEKEHPPKSGKFIVFCIGKEEQENTYVMRKGRKIYDTINIREKLDVLEWVGVAEWREMAGAFYIETTCRNFERGFVVQPELTDNMKWSTLPESWTLSQPNYKELVKEQKVKRPSFFQRVLNMNL